MLDSFQLISVQNIPLYNRPGVFRIFRQAFLLCDIFYYFEYHPMIEFQNVNQSKYIFVSIWEIRRKGKQKGAYYKTFDKHDVN